MTTGGVVTNHFPVPTPGSEPSDITTGPDGALWFTESSATRSAGSRPLRRLFRPPPVSSLTP